MQVYYPKTKKYITLTPLEEEFFLLSKGEGCIEADHKWYKERFDDLQTVYNNKYFLGFMNWYANNHAFIDKVGIDKADILIYDLLENDKLRESDKIKLANLILKRNQALTTKKTQIESTPESTKVIFEESVLPPTEDK